MRGHGLYLGAGLGSGTAVRLLFVVVSVTGLRSRIISEIPMHLKKAIGIGIGMVHFVHRFKKCVLA